MTSEEFVKQWAKESGIQLVVDKVGDLYQIWIGSDLQPLGIGATQEQMWESAKQNIINNQNK